MGESRVKAFAIRWFPRIAYCNFHKEYPSSVGAFTKWFDVRTYWHGRLVYVSVKHHTIILDFRATWITDMMQGTRP